MHHQSSQTDTNPIAIIHTQFTTEREARVRDVVAKRESMSDCGVRRMKLGSQGLEVSAQGLGCMSLSAFFGVPAPKTDPIALLHHAIGSGVTFLDTADSYGPQTNELLLAKVRFDQSLLGFR